MGAESARSTGGQTASSGEADAEESVRLEVYRYDPDNEEKLEPHFDVFRVPIERGMTVLDALIYARDTYDSSLTFRHSCRMGVCGSDGLFINGSQRLGCKTQMSDLETPVRVEPLPHEPVIKDLVVEMDHFFERMDAVDPYFQPGESDQPDGEERRQTPENREKIKTAARCIQCGCCTSSCNPSQTDDQYIGPAAIVKAYRFYFDEREGEDERSDRLDTLAQEHGVWQCHTQFSCTEVCPQDIPITEYIQELKREAVKRDIPL